MAVRQFNLYDVTGFVFPGAFALAGAGFLAGVTVESLSSLSLGGFGAVLVGAYIVGYLLQGIGAALADSYYRAVGGQPTDWAGVSPGCDMRWPYLSDPQRTRLHDLAKQSGLFPGQDASKEWPGFVRQCIAMVHARGRGDRLDRFMAHNATARGIATAALLLFVAHGVLLLYAAAHGVWPGPLDAVVAAALVGTILLAGASMRRQGIQFAREVFVQYMNIKEAVPRNGGTQPVGGGGVEAKEVLISNEHSSTLQ